MQPFFCVKRCYGSDNASHGPECGIYVIVMMFQILTTCGIQRLLEANMEFIRRAARVGCFF